MKCEMLRSITGHESRITAICFSEDDQFIFTSSKDRTVKKWNLDDLTMKKSFNNFDSEVNCIVLSKDNRYILSAFEKEIIM